MHSRSQEHGLLNPAFVKIRIFAPAQTLAKSLDLRAELLDLVLKILPHLLSSAYLKKLSRIKSCLLYDASIHSNFKAGLGSWDMAEQLVKERVTRWLLAIRPNWWKFLVCCLLLGVWLRVDSSGKKQLPRSEAAMAEATDLGPITLQLDGHHLTFEDCVWLPGPSSLSSCMKETPIFCFLKSGIENVSLPMSCNKITRVPVQTFRRQLVVFSFSSFVLNFLQVASQTSLTTCKSFQILCSKCYLELNFNISHWLSLKLIHF